MKKNEKPTSFSLDAELLERLRQAAHDLRTTRTGFVQSALADWLDRAAAGQVAVDPETSEPRLTHSGDSPIPNSSTPPPPAGLLEFPSLLAALPPDDAWLLHQLARILKDRPQGDIFAILETTLHKAVRAYVATQPATTNKVDSGKSPTLKSSVVRVDIPELDLPWVQKLLKIRRSPKPGLNRALENNMVEFEWVDEAYHRLASLESPPVPLAAPGGGGRHETPGNLPGAAQDRGRGTGDAPAHSDLTGDLDEIEESKTRRQSGAPRVARKGGERR